MISNYLKGICIGIIDLIPGISGGTVAVIIGLYDKVLSSIDVLTSKKEGKLKALKFLIILGSGVFSGIFLFSYIISYLIEFHNEMTFMFLIGLIAGSIPFLIKQSSKEKQLKNWPFLNFLSFIIPIIFFIFLSFSKIKSESEIITQVNLDNFYIILLMGIMACFTLVIPGVSGSFLMLILGFYPSYVNALKHLNLSILILFYIGGVIGFLLATKIMSNLFKKAYKITYYFIIGLVLGSIYMIFPEITPGIKGTYSLIVMFIGFLLSYLLGNKNINLKTIVLFFLFDVILIIFTFLNTNERNIGNFNTEKILNIAHRGGINEEDTDIKIENTLQAFKNSSEIADVFEMDIRLSKDKEVIIFHDSDFKRLFNKEDSIENLNFSELKNMLLNNNLKDSAVTRLEDLLKTYNKLMVVELKGQEDELIKKAGDLFEKYNRWNQVIVSSENYKVTKKFRKLYPRAITSAAYDEVVLFLIFNTFFASSLYKADFEFFIIPEEQYGIRIFKNSIVKALNKANIPIFIWTINDSNKLNSLLKTDISGIVTDEPVKLKKIIENK